ncbi:MAG: hypothetical protein QOD32_1576 [Pyrinomonadaceae bacterium]|jgi:hypothetical protein|nr:hypothetical protein [Pyrinomonadaceae bacterium]
MLIRDSDLQERMASLRDEQLLEIVTARRVEYRQAALDLAAQELMRRQVSFELAAADQSKLTSPAGRTRGEGATVRESAATDEFQSPPPLGTILTSGHEQIFSRRDKLKLLVGSYAFLALIAWSLYADSSNPTRMVEKVLFWFHVVLFVVGISTPLVRKLLNKI